MLNPLSAMIARRYSSYAMIVLLALVGVFFWLFNFSAFPASNSALLKISGGVGFLDLRPFYTAQAAYAALTHYGAAGRNLYQHFLAVDFFFALSYGLGFSLLITRIIKTSHGTNSAWMIFNLLPLAVALADCSENTFILVMLHGFPKFYPAVSTMAGFATAIKWGATLVTLAFLAVESGLLVYRRSKKVFNG